MAYCTVSQCCKHTVKDGLCAIHQQVELGQQDYRKNFSSISANAQVFAKIEKLLALASASSGATVDEAATAGAMAQALLQKHNLSMEDLPKEQREEYGQTDIPKERGWERTLVNSVARNNFCRAVGEQDKITIVGKPSNVLTMMYLFNFLKYEIRRLAEVSKRIHGRNVRGYSTNFCNGAVKEVGLKLDAQHAANQPNSNSTALVLRIDREVEDAMRGMFPYLRQVTRRLNAGHGYGAGREAGRGIGMHTGIETRSSRLVTA